MRLAKTLVAGGGAWAATALAASACAGLLDLDVHYADASAPDSRMESGPDAARDDGPAADDAETSCPPGPITFMRASFAKGGAATVVSPSFDRPIHAHAAIIVAGTFDGPAGTATISDTLQNNYTTVANYSAPAWSAFMAFALDTAPGTDQVTVKVPFTTDSFSRSTFTSTAGLP
jgi:hypothetical protein